MVEIRYKGYYEVANLAGKSLADVRQQYREKFGIPDKASARLNDRKIKAIRESEVSLRDADEVRFAEPNGRGSLLLGSLLLALAVTGGVFASGFINATTTLSLVSQAGGDFASVTTAGSGLPQWKVWGLLKAPIGNSIVNPGGPWNLFSVNSTAGYSGDLVVTVSVANGDQLVKVYRVLNLFLEVVNSAGNLVDINANGVNSTAEDYSLLTLSNGSADFFISQLTGSDNYTIRLNHGYYVANVYPLGGWTAGSQQPVLYAEVAQR